MLVFAEIGYSITTRFLKLSTFTPAPLALPPFQAFNVLVFAEIGYSVTTRFLKMSTFHPRVFRGNPLCFISMAVTAVLQVFLTYTPGVNAFFSMPGVGKV